MAERSLPTWKQVFDRVDKTIGPHLNEFVRSEEFATLVALQRRGELREPEGRRLADLQSSRGERPSPGGRSSPCHSACEQRCRTTSGAPFTLASYTIEGGSSRSYLHTKTLMYRDEGAWRTLMERLARSITRYLNAQIAAGAQCVQLFDSWVGCLGPDDYRRYVLPFVKQIITGLTPGVPVINFATGNPALLPLLAEAGGTVIGIDWRVRLDDAWKTVGYDRAVQGNLDPLVLLADKAEIRRRAKQVLDQAANRPGHIFNLGHGVVQQTPVENAIALVDAVHELSRR
jgi:uroporphyrinogen-III decarboxylase